MSRIALDALVFTLASQYQDRDTLYLSHVNRAKLVQITQAGTREEADKGNPVGSIPATVSRLGAAVGGVQRCREDLHKFRISPWAAVRSSDRQSLGLTMGASVSTPGFQRRTSKGT